MIKGITDTISGVSKSVGGKAGGAISGVSDTVGNVGDSIAGLCGHKKGKSKEGGGGKASGILNAVSSLCSAGAGGQGGSTPQLGNLAGDLLSGLP